MSPRPSTGSGASLSFTHVGQTISICITDDHVKWGLYPALNIQSNYNYAIGNTTGNITSPRYDYADYSYTTSKAEYLMHPVPDTGVTGAIEAVEVTLVSQSGGGSETPTLYYSSYCTVSFGGCTDSGNVGPTDTMFVIAVDLPPPAVNSLSPVSGPEAGGTTVTITGSGFSGTTGAGGVKFGTTNATSYTVVSGTSITATAPAGTGTVHVTVTNNSVTSATSAADQYTYVAAPTITSISPNSGPAAGGTSVTITGTNFSGATAVKFGATAAASFTVVSATSITATSPAGTGTVDITVTTAGGTSATSASDQFTYVAAPTVTSISPTSGPAAGGTLVTITGTNFSGATAVTFGGTAATSFTVVSATSITATATSGGGTPTGTVTFNDNGVPIGTATLSGGVAAFTSSSLSIGNHSITVNYTGGGGFAPSVSTALLQTVNVPADSAKLRALQVTVTKLVAQNSGQAISGAIDSAISEGFADNGTFVMPGQASLRFNFAADPVDPDSQPVPKEGSVPATSSAYTNPTRADHMPPPGRGRGRGSRVDEAFNAIDQQMPKKVPHGRVQEQKDWLFWIDIRGFGVNRLSTSTTVTGVTTTQSSLYGQQVNALGGLTYKLNPDLLVGFLGGYESFSFTDQDVNGKLTGNGWTAGSYLGWRITPTLRYDAAVAYSGIDYNGTAGTAQGSFTGQRWLLQTGLTGSYPAWGAVFEPSARVYALWENQRAYVDSLGTPQGEHNFATGRASGGLKAVYPFPWVDADIVLAPYLGIYGDYYFTRDNADAIIAAGGVPLASTPLLQGWSARMVGGLGARFSEGGAIGLGGEYGGLGSDTRTWTVKARAQVPFAAH